MKIKEGFIIKEVADSFVVVPVGENLVDFSSMITTNETGAFIWNLLSEDKTADELAEALVSEYSVDLKTAKADVEEFLSVLKSKKVFEE